MSTNSSSSKHTNSSAKSASVGLLAALLASLCCITPVISLLAGIGGIAATFSWMEPFRPYLIVLTIGGLAFAWYQKLKPSKKLSGQEEIDCACDTDEEPSFWQSKKFLGIVTVFAALMLAFPTYSHIFYPDSEKAVKPITAQSEPVKHAEFKIKGMTCSGCESHINTVVSQLAGVDSVKASYQDANTFVKYDPSKVNRSEIVNAINKTGYTVIEKSN